MIATLDTVVPRLQAAGVEFLVIGGWAAVIHGSARVTLDVDVVYRRDRDNLERVVDALTPLEPYLRGAPAGLPFCLDIATLRMGLNFTLTTTIGDIDLFGEVTGGGTYEDLLPYSEIRTATGMTCRVVTLERLIQLKRAAGRPRDLEVIAELQALLEERRKLMGS